MSSEIFPQPYKITVVVFGKHLDDDLLRIRGSLLLLSFPCIFTLSPHTLNYDSVLKAFSEIMKTEVSVFKMLVDDTLLYHRI